MDQMRQMAWWLGILHRVGLDLCYWLITGSGKIVSSTSVEHVIHDDYLQEDIKKQIDDFNQKLEDALDDANFQVDGDGKYTSMYLNDIECPDDTNSGMAQEEENVPSLEEYDDMG